MVGDIGMVAPVLMGEPQWTSCESSRGGKPARLPLMEPGDVIPVRFYGSTLVLEGLDWQANTKQLLGRLRSKRQVLLHSAQAGRHVGDPIQVRSLLTSSGSCKIQL